MAKKSKFLGSSAASPVPNPHPESSEAAELHPLARELMTEAGLLNHMVEVKEKARRGGMNRDEISALTIERQVLDFFAKKQKEEKELTKADELMEELKETQRLIRSNNAGSTSFDASIDLPHGEGIEAN